MANTTSGASAIPVSTVSRVPQSRRRSILGRVILYAVLICIGVVTAAPFVVSISGSFKLNSEIFSYPVTILPKEPITSNYVRLLNGSEIPYVRQFGNSIVIALSQTTLNLAIASTVGWGFAKYEFKGKRVLFLFLIATLTFPFQIVIVPLFLLMFNIGWVDNILGVIVPGAISAFGAFFMRQAMVSVPNELVDAARVDGASEFRIFWQVGLPLVRGALSVLAVLSFLGAWNDYLWPLIVLRTDENFTYPIGLASLVGLYKVEYGMILAGAVIATVPILAIFLAGRNSLLDNVTIGAVKG